MVYFEHLRRRIGFPVMQAHCAEYHLPTAQGWGKLHDKFTDIASKSADDAKEIASSLERIFRETIPVGERAVRIFTLPASVVKELAIFFQSSKPERSAYLATYPAPVPGNELADLDSAPKLCEIVELAGSGTVTLVFCARRVVEERDPRTKDQMSGELLSKFGWDAYDEFILVKKNYVQSYEIVHIDPAKNMVELRLEVHTGVDVSFGLGKLQEKFNELIAAKFGINGQLIKCVNLFPAIKDMYDDHTEGMVVELGFTTDTGSAKNEKMRQSDLRTELFHAGGKAAVKDAITPFRLAVRWPKSEAKLQEEALLPGSIRQLGSSMPFLDHMVLSGSLNESHLQETIQRVVRHL